MLILFETFAGYCRVDRESKEACVKADWQADVAHYVCRSDVQTDEWVHSAAETKSPMVTALSLNRKEGK